MHSGFANFVGLPTAVLLGVGAAFLLVVSPVLLEALPAQLLVLGLAVAAARFRKIQALGMSLIGLPAAAALLLTDGDASARSAAALLAMLEFYALEQIFWGLSEDSPQPWWTLGLVWLWMPSVLGLLGMALLFVVCHQRWRSGLASVRHTQKHSLARGWGAVGLALLLLVAVSSWLGLPKPERVVLPEIPGVVFSQQSPAPAPEPASRTTALSEAPRPALGGLPYVGGAEFVALLMLLYLYFAWRRLQVPRPRGKARGAKGGLWFALMLLTGVVCLLVLFGLGGQTSPRQSVAFSFDPSGGAWLSLLLFMLLFIAWRIHQARKKGGAPKLEPAEMTLRFTALTAPDDAVRAAYAHWLLWLRDVELRRSPTQTPSEFGQVVCVQHPTMRQPSQVLTSAYERVRYGAIPSQTELEQVLDALEQWRLELGRLLPEGVSLPEMQVQTTERTRQVREIQV
jgi:hypothetical protein